MPNRILREGILTSERISSLGWPAEVFYRRLMSVVDDFGRYYAKPELLRAGCYPLLLDKVGNSDIGKWMSACTEAALVRTYTVEGKEYLEVANFKQQKRAEKSRFPAPPIECIADATQATSKSEAAAHLGVCGGEGDTANAVAADAALPCPHDKIIDLYHELLPVCPRVADWTDARQTLLRGRWRERAKPKGKARGYGTMEDGLVWWRDFLAYCAKSEFLTGRAPGRDGKPPFMANLEWIVTPSNFVKIIEGNYHR